VIEYVIRVVFVIMPDPLVSALVAVWVWEPWIATK
jgi:hypothetical protein